MAGQIHKMIQSIIEQRAKGNTTLIATTKTKLVLKGINPDKYNELSEDDPSTIGKLKDLAKDLGVTL